MSCSTTVHVFPAKFHISPHFPRQNLLNISCITSSLTDSPVISLNTVRIYNIYCYHIQGHAAFIRTHGKSILSIRFVIRFYALYYNQTSLFKETSPLTNSPLPLYQAQGFLSSFYGHFYYLLSLNFPIFFISSSP